LEYKFQHDIVRAVSKLDCVMSLTRGAKSVVNQRYGYC